MKEQKKISVCFGSKKLASQFHLEKRGNSKGIQVHRINPAYTSVIGGLNYAKRYGLSIHHAASLCTGRRFLGVSEKMAQGQREIPDGKAGHLTLDLSERNRSGHAWYQRGQHNKKLPAALTAHFLELLQKWLLR